MRFVAAYRWIPVALLLLMTACYGRPPAGAGDDPNGATTFAKSYGGEFDDVPLAAIETADGGYAFVGKRGDSLGNSSYSPLWLVRLDANGNVIWQYTLSESAIGGILGYWPYNIVAAAVPGGGFCLAGTVAGQAGDTADLYVGFLDAQDNLVWEHRVDSGGWAGYEVIAAGDRGAFAHDQAVAVKAGPGGSCYVGGISFAHLRDSFGVGIRNSSGSLVIDGGDFIDARSIVVARVDSTGSRWLRRNTEGAFDNQLPVDRQESWTVGSYSRGDTETGSQTLTMLTTADGGIAVASRVNNDRPNSHSYASTIRVDYYDASGTPDRLLTRYRQTALPQNKAPLTYAVRVAEVDSDIVVASSDIYSRVGRDGTLRWDRAELDRPRAIHGYVDPSGSRIAVFGTKGEDPFGVVRLLDAANGDPLSDLPIPDTVDITAAASLQSPGHFLAVASGQSSPGAQLLELDLLASDPVVSRSALADSADGIQVDNGVAYGANSTALNLRLTDGTTRSIRLATSVIFPTGLVELSGDRLGIALSTSGDNSNVGYLIVGPSGVESSIAIDLVDFGESVETVVPHPGGGGALLMKSWGGQGRRGIALVQLADDGRIASQSETIKYDYVDSPMRLRPLPGGGFATLIHDRSGQDLGAFTVRFGSDGAIAAVNRYAGRWDDFAALADGGLVLAYKELEEGEMFTLLRVDAAGAPVWKRSYGLAGLGVTPWVGTDFRRLAIEATADGALVVATTTRGLLTSGYAGPGGRPLPYGEQNITLTRVAGDGTPEWLRVHGAFLNETLMHMTMTSDGGFLVSAVSDSLGQPSADGLRLTNEAWMLRLGPDGRVSAGCNAYLAELAGFVLNVADLSVSAESTVIDPDLIRIPSPEYVITESNNALSIGSPPVVEARQCVGISATGNVLAAPGSFRTLVVSQAGSIDGLITSSPGGIFCGGADPQFCSRDFADGSSTYLVVDDSSAAEFRGWGGDGCAAVTTGPHRCEVLMNSDRNVATFFEPWDGNTATLTIDVTGAGRVVAVEPAGIDCYDDETASDCAEIYRLGQRVLLTVYEQPGESFLGWGGDCAAWATADTIRVSVDNDQTCTAQFSGVGYTPRYRVNTGISIDDLPPPAGVVPGGITSVPSGVDCGTPGTDCTGEFDSGSTVSLLARAATDYRFARWYSNVSGSVCDGATTERIDIVVSSNIDCRADFTFVGGNVSVLTIETRLDGAAPPPGGPFGGNVTSTPAGIDCGSTGADCVEGYAPGTTVVLIASADAGYRFSQWSGDCAGTSSSAPVIVSVERLCVAEFAREVSNTAVLNITINGSGNVQSNPPGIDCGVDCQQSYPLNSLVTLVASGTLAEPFQSWSGDCSGGSGIQVVMSANRNCTATFAPASGSFRLSITVIGNGIVTTVDGGIACPSDCVEDYANGAIAQVQVVPGAGETLIGWSGDCLDLAQSTQFELTMARDWSCTATFGP